MRMVSYLNCHYIAKHTNQLDGCTSWVMQVSEARPTKNKQDKAVGHKACALLNEQEMGAVDREVLR